MTRVLVPFTTGVEEIEFVAIVDLLRRAEIEVCMASLDGQPVAGRSNITMAADAALADVVHQPWDMVVLPGGLPNAHLLRDDANVEAVLRRMKSELKPVAAICAAPTALAAYGMTKGLRVTSYPAFQSRMQELQPSSIYVDEVVVEDGCLITSRGAGTAVAFSLRLIARLCGETKAEEIRGSIVA